MAMRQKKVSLLKIVIWTICAFSLLHVGNSAVFPASFDCRKAKSYAEKTICATPELSSADSRLSELYKQAKAAQGNSKEFRALTLNNWQKREACRDISCLQSWYINSFYLYEGLLGGRQNGSYARPVQRRGGAGKQALSMAPVTAQGAMSDYAFCALCEKGTVEEVRRALASGANANARDKHGNTVLMLAAEENSNPEVVKALLKRGADVNARNRMGNTVLMLGAMKNPNPEVFKTLLASGADVYAKNPNGATALMWAAQMNPNPEVVKVLLENGAYVRAVDIDGHSAYWYARTGELFHGNRDRVLQLLERYR